MGNKFVLHSTLNNNLISTEMETENVSGNIDVKSDGVKNAK